MLSEQYNPEVFVRNEAWLYTKNTIVGFTRIAVNPKFHSWFANFKLTKFRVRVDDSWFRNLKLTSSYETTTKS